MKTIAFLLVSFLSLSVFSQKMDSVFVQDIADQVLTIYLENNYLSDDNNQRNGDCVFGKSEGFTLSCIYTSWDVDWSTDFDGDSNQDLVIQVTDEGLGGGGNAFGYNFVFVTLDSNKKIKEVYPIFGGGKLSYALLSIDSISNGRMFASYEQNMFAYGYEELDEDNLGKVSLQFYMENEMIFEESYKKCPIAEMSKDIFKENTGFKIDKDLSLDDSYNFEQIERLYLNDETYYFASIAGCEDINFYVTRTIAYNPQLEDNQTAIKKVWLEHIQFLKENTRYKTLFTEMYEKISNLKPQNLSIDEYGGAQKEITLKGNWKCVLFVSGNPEQGSFITIRLTKTEYDEPLEFWEALEKKSKL